MVTVRLEFSEDDLSVSNASATWVDVTDLLKAGTLRISGGIDRLGDPPRAGEMSFTLLGTDFVPLNEASPYYPNVVRRRRFRYSVLRGATWQSRFLGYARTFQPVWPGNVTHQEVDVVCGDGFDVLAFDRLPSLDPPDAVAYEDVVLHDDPWGYWPLGDAPSSATIAAAAGPEAVVRARFTIKRKKKKRRRGVPGSAGVIKTRSLVTLGQPGGILGDGDTAAAFATSGTSEGHIEVPLPDLETLSAGDTLTVECWVKTTSSDVALVSGPDSGAGVIWALTIGAIGALGSDDLAFTVETQGATVQATQASTGANDGEWHHVVGVWVGGQARLYLDGVLVGTASGIPPVLTPAASPKLRIGSLLPADNTGLNGSLDEVAVYEHALSAERILAHYQAGAERGFPEQSAGERIAEAADHTLWSTAALAATDLTVQATMKTGQSPIEAITDAARAEGLRTLFFFDGAGDPVYRGWEWQAETIYSTVQETFGAPPEGSELAFDEQGLRFDDEVYNSVTKARVDGVAHTETDAASEALIGPSVAEPVTDLILADDADVPKLCGEHLALYRDPSYALDTLTLHGSDDDQLEAILDLEIGDMIRYKRRSHHEDGSLADPIDVITWVIGFEETLQAGAIPVRTLRLARGINGAQSVWRAGLVGFSEADSTTVAA